MSHTTGLPFPGASEKLDTLLRRFSERLAQLRNAEGLSQEALASGSKFHPTYISALERGRKVPSLTTIERLARALKVDVREMLDFPDNADSKSDSNHAEKMLILKSLEKADARTHRKARKIIQALME